MYEWTELIKLWEHEQVTETQVIGQLLKHGEAQHVRMTALLRRVEQLEQALTARPGTPPLAGAGKPMTERR